MNNFLLRLFSIWLVFGCCTSCSKVADRITPNAPIFADPNYNGSTDPEIIYNSQNGDYYIFYTCRRPLSGETFVKCPIGVIKSKDLVHWEFLGYCKFDGVGGLKDSELTFWAPGMIVVGDSCHMYVTRKEDSTPPWGGPSKIVHYSAPLNDLVNGWVLSEVTNQSPQAIDACIFVNPQKQYTLIYRDCRSDKDRCGTYWATSNDLKNWEEHGLVAGDVDNIDLHKFNYQEGANVIEWKGFYWLITDPHHGLPVYKSTDGVDWKYQGLILDKPGKRLYDGNFGRHASMIVTKDDRAFIVYHVEPLRDYVEYDDTKISTVNQLCFLQIAELEIKDGKLTCNRDKEILLDRK